MLVTVFFVNIDIHDVHAGSSIVYYTASFGTPVISEDFESNFSHVHLEGSNASLFQVGKPILPVCNKLIKLPFGSEIISIDCEPEEILDYKIEDKIMPSPAPLSSATPIPQLKPGEPCIPYCTTTYSSEEFYPTSWFNYSLGCGITNNEHINLLNLYLYPVRYSPGTDTLRFIKNITVTITYEIQSDWIFSDDEYDMVIVSPSGFIDELFPFVEYKQDCGLSSLVVTLEDITDSVYFPIQGRDLQEQIKYFIMNCIETWGVTYVLFIGDEDHIPVRQSYTYDGEEDKFMSDLYYADIFKASGAFCSWDDNDNALFAEYYAGNVDNVDLYPDIYFGRLAVKTEQELSAIVTKIIDFASSAQYLDERFSTMVLVGGDTHDDTGNVCEGERVCITSYSKVSSLGFEPHYVFATNELLYDANNIDSAIENGAGFLLMEGHGNPYSWSTHPPGKFNRWIPDGGGYTYTMAENLQNNNQFPVVILGACDVCKFTSNECLGWSFVKNSYGGGIACFGNSALAWGYHGNYATKGLGGGMTVSAFFSYANEETQTLGELWCTAINNYISRCGLSEKATSFKTIQEWQSFCDPSLFIKKVSNPPDVPQKPEGPAIVDAGTNSSFIAGSSDTDGDNIKYCYDWDDDSYSWSDWTESGEAVILDHVWNNSGDYTVQVKTRDEYGLDSPWSEPLSVHVCAPELEITNVTSRFSLISANLKNTGDMDASDLNCMIWITGKFLSRIDFTDEANIEHLGQNQVAEISTKCPIGFGIVTIQISVSAPYTYTETRSFDAFVCGPLVIILS